MAQTIEWQADGTGLRYEAGEIVAAVYLHPSRHKWRWTVRTGANMDGEDSWTKESAKVAAELRIGRIVSER